MRLAVRNEACLYSEDKPDFPKDGQKICAATIEPPGLQRMQAAAKMNPVALKGRMAGGADDAVFTALFSHGKERHPASL